MIVRMILALIVAALVLTSSIHSQQPVGPCRIKSMTGTRVHEGRGTTFQLSVTNVVYATGGREFSGTLIYSRQQRRGVTSSEPFTGRVEDDGSIRIDSRFESRDAAHTVRIVGVIENGKFSGKEGNYGVVTATVDCLAP